MSSANSVADKKGVVYIGHMPIGFEEQQIFDYFKQFGKVRRVKVSRSIKTGQPKGYGYVQFKDEEVATIAAQSMNNYIMFRKSLKAHVVEPEKVHKQLFKGTNRPFHSTKKSLRAIARYNNVSKKPSALKKRVKRQNTAIKRLKSLGYEFEVSDIVPETEIKTGTEKLKTGADRRQDSSTKSMKLEKSKKSPAGSNKASPGSRTPAVKNEEDLVSDQSKVKSSQEKSKKLKKKVTIVDKTPTILRDGLIGDESDDEISFRTPHSLPIPTASKVSSTKKGVTKPSTEKKVFPKTPVPKRQDGIASPLSSSKSSQDSSKRLKTNVLTSDASPALPVRTMKAKTKTPLSNNKRRSNVETLATTPKNKTPKISPRVTRSVAKKRKSMV